MCNQDWDLMDGMVACRELDPAVNLSRKQCCTIKGTLVKESLHSILKVKHK